MPPAGVAFCESFRPVVDQIQEQTGVPDWQELLMDKMAYRPETDLPFEKVVDGIERPTPENNFRVLAVHDVQATPARLTMISEMLPRAGLDDLAADVETRLMTIMEQTIQ
jgi:hypothetical protein